MSGPEPEQPSLPLPLPPPDYRVDRPQRDDVPTEDTETSSDSDDSDDGDRPGVIVVDLV